MIISCLNQKGGVGKTTIATNLAFCLAKKNYKVLLADSDPQQSSMHWANVRHFSTESKPLPFSILGVNVNSIINDLPKLIINASYDFIIIDGAPRLSDLSRAAIIKSNLIIMPMQPSSFDLWATIEMRDLINEAQIYNPNLISAVLLNRVLKHSSISKSVMEELKEDTNWSFFDTQIGQRQAFVNASSCGRTVFEISGSKVAQNEILNVATEILEFSNSI